MAKKRKSSDDSEFDEDHELAMVGGVGSINSITETPKKRRKPVKRRPIGYLANIDKMEDAE